MQKTTATVVFDEFVDQDPPRVKYHDDARHTNGARKVIYCSVEIRGDEAIQRAREARPGDTIRVTELTDWDDPDIPEWISEFEVVAERQAAAA